MEHLHLHLPPRRPNEVAPLLRRRARKNIFHRLRVRLLLVLVHVILLPCHLPAKNSCALPAAAPSILLGPVVFPCFVITCVNRIEFVWTLHLPQRLCDFGHWLSVFLRSALALHRARTATDKALPGMCTCYIRTWVTIAFSLILTCCLSTSYIYTHDHQLRKYISNYFFFGGVSRRARDKTVTVTVGEFLVYGSTHVQLQPVPAGSLTCKHISRSRARHAVTVIFLGGMI